jgi:hypothetical protein
MAIAVSKPKTKPTTAQIERVAEVLYDLLDSVVGYEGQGLTLRPKEARELAGRLIEALK